MPDDLSQSTVPVSIPDPASIPPTPPTPTIPPVVPPPPPAISPPPVLKKEPKMIKTLLAIFILFILTVSVPLATFLTSQRQEVRKEAQGEICCRVEAKNLCTPGFGSWDMTVGSFATEAECDAYIANSTFSYSCNCCATCTNCSGPQCEDQNQSCGPETACSGTHKIRCSSSGSDLRKIIVNQAACAGPTVTPPAAATPTPTSVGCYKPCTKNVTVCEPGLVCEDSNEGYGTLPLDLCVNHSCPGSSTCQCTPTTTPIPSGTPRPTATPTRIATGTPRPTATPTQPGYTLSCLTCKAYDTNWNQITPSNIQLNQTVYFATQGSTNHPQGITKARFRINGGAWQETTNKHGNLFYIQYTVATAGSYLVESMVYNPILNWH